MKNHTKVTQSPVNMEKIRNSLGFKHKLPSDFTFEGNLELFSSWEKNSLGIYFVKVIPARYQGKPRIFIGHKGRFIPAGRTAQANA